MDLEIEEVDDKYKSCPHCHRVTLGIQDYKHKSTHRICKTCCHCRKSSRKCTKQKGSLTVTKELDNLIEQLHSLTYQLQTLASETDKLKQQLD